MPAPAQLPLLFEGRFEAYFAAAGAPAPLWLFVHVPKTAGSSLSTELARDLQPYHNIHIDHADRSRPALARFDEAVGRFLARHGQRPFRFASGHIHHRHAQEIKAAVPGLRMLTMLREPLSRLASDFLYQRSSMHPHAAEVRARVPGLAAFAALPGQRNRAARHLVPREIVMANDGAAAVAHVLSSYAFVGVQESYALGFQALTRLLGRERPPERRQRVNEAPDPARDEVARLLADPGFREEMEMANAVDFALYRHVSEAWGRIAGPLSAWLAASARKEEAR